jgi:uncharacterized protein (TIGR02452 family)
MSVMGAMGLKGTAEQTLKVIDDGQYLAPSGAPRSVREETQSAIEGTVLYRPGDVAALRLPYSPGQAVIEVTAETTAVAARRLCEEGERVVLLNFASARNPGGGFLRGAKAQEEDLARCSALYSCLVTQPEYYAANRAQSSVLYTDHLIYSPDVPFFRDERLDFLERPFFPSVITSPAPNAGEMLARDPRAQSQIHKALVRRARQVLAVAAAHEHRTLVLGAWGCGVFRNDPVEVAGVFGQALDESGGTFARVVFAVWERSGDGPNLQAFRARFTAAR